MRKIGIKERKEEKEEKEEKEKKRGKWREGKWLKERKRREI